MTDGNQQRQSSCKRCGSCCKQGGPALHSADLDLVRAGHLHFEDLITVRRGELALQPLADKPETVTEEFLKLKGQGSDWCCRFYDPQAKGCTIYHHRPVACGLLDCSHPDELLAIAGRDLLNRFDLLSEGDPVLDLVKLHEETCPCPPLAELLNAPAAEKEAALEGLSNQVNLDLAVRSRAAREFGLSVDLELFYFGRPLFQLLQPLGFSVAETRGGLMVRQSPA